MIIRYILYIGIKEIGAVLRDNRKNTNMSTETRDGKVEDNSLVDKLDVRYVSAIIPLDKGYILAVNGSNGEKLRLYFPRVEHEKELYGLQKAFEEDPSMHEIYETHGNKLALVSSVEIPGIIGTARSSVSQDYDVSLGIKETRKRKYKFEVKFSSSQNNLRLSIQNGVPEERITAEFLDVPENPFGNPIKHMMRFYYSLEGRTLDVFYKDHKGQEIQFHPDKGLNSREPTSEELVNF